MNANGFYCIDNAFLENFGPALRASGIAIYNVLAMHADGSGTCWPSHETIANLAGCSRRHIIRELGRMEALGLIRIESRRDGGKHSNRYILLYQRGMLPPTDVSSGHIDVTPEHIDSPSDVTHSHNRCVSQSQPM